IPAGGYVKIIGMSNLETVDPADEPRTYRQQSFPRRLAVAVAGSTVHLILAFLLIFTVVSVVGVPRASMRVGEVSALESGPSPAQQAGFEVGDRIISVDGQAFDEWSDLPPYIRANPGRALRFSVERDGRTIELVATPVDLANIEVEGRPVATEPTGFVGIGPATAFERVNPIVGVGQAGRGVGVGVVEVVRALGRIFSPDGISNYFKLLSGQAPEGPGDGDENRFLSPVGFVKVASQAANTGLFEVLSLLIAINLFVGVFNMLPMLPLDGGHVAIAVYERVRSRRGRRYQLDVARLMPATYLVFALILFIGVTSLYLDVVRPLANPFQ
ncbi:MAG: M50 family metallopeptidase, partial [Acidimicrobiales bacterium]